MLRQVVAKRLQRLIDDDITLYASLPTNSMWADILTKEKKMPLTFEKVITSNGLALGDTTVNKVKDGKDD